MKRTRLTVIFNGAKFDYEINEPMGEVGKLIDTARMKDGVMWFYDTDGKYIEIDPNMCPIIEIVELNYKSD